MAEHDEKLFEHEFAEKLRKFDDNIIIPEIPDAQSIFDRAESEKAKVIPFKKYSRYIAAAAAVVLICVSVPLLSPALSAETAPQEPMEEPKMFDNMADAANDTVFTEESLKEPEACSEEPCENAPETINDVGSTTETEDGLTDEKTHSSVAAEKNIKKMLEAFFAENDVELNPQIGANEIFRTYTLNEEINKKRSIDITVEEESVSVILFDNSLDKEVICAFWIQGAYKESYYEGEKYFVKTYIKLSGEMVRADDYLPMFGDMENGTAFIDENKISAPDRLKKGAMVVTAEIDIATGEYEIYAEVI